MVDDSGGDLPLDSRDAPVEATRYPDRVERGAAAARAESVNRRS